MTSNALISIVIPTYNGMNHLAESIESCLNQTHRNVELIVVDDASTDETPVIVSKYVASDSRVRLVRHTENRKLPAALNTGFAHAHGDFLTWTSDDNRYRPQALEAMLGYLSDHPEIHIVYSDRALIDEKGAVLGLHVAPEPGELPYWNSVGGSFLFRRCVFEALRGYDESFFLAEDFEFWLRASRCFKFHALHEDLYLYRVHQGSLSAKHERQVRVATIRVLERYLPDMPWNRASRSLAYLRLAREAAYLGERRSGWSYLGKATLTSPRSVFSWKAWHALLLLLLNTERFSVLKAGLSRITRSKQKEASP